jgi:hypothetical protein
LTLTAGHPTPEPRSRNRSDQLPQGVARLPHAPPSDSTSRLLLAQLDVEGFEALLQQWMAAQPGVAIAQSTYATDTGGEIAVLRQLLDRVELEGLLVQADALHANRGLFSTSSSVEPTS